MARSPITRDERASVSFSPIVNANASTSNSVQFVTVAKDRRRHSLENMLANLHIFFEGDILTYSFANLTVLPQNSSSFFHAPESYFVLISKGMNE